MNKNIAEELGLPVIKTKSWKKNFSVKKPEEFESLNPIFCTRIDSKTGKKCGNILTGWSSQFWDLYKACEECTKKYHLDKGKFFPK